ncbi:hypothetical protein F4778DRAFT_746435 [Xylariomycetidae sp. FL2044]|nr:hypothetical protein F4778DRAFT_746435 [Xylariomycetidae sp. FL2044]
MNRNRRRYLHLPSSITSSSSINNAHRSERESKPHAILETFQVMRSPSPIVPLPKDDSYLPECFAWYAIGVITIILRYVTRIRTVGISGFRGDDYLALLYLILYTACIVIVYITYYTGGAVNVTPEIVDLLTDEDVKILRMGSWIEWISFFIYSGCIWTLKFSVLFFYNRLTLGVLRRKTIKFLFWACGVSYVVLCLIALLSCRPIPRNWQVRPLPGPVCVWGPQNFWALVFINVISDAALMSIPLPILWHLRVSIRKKIGVTLLLSSAIFVISTAIVRAVLTLDGRPTIITINLWGFRELAVGLISVTAPVVYPIVTPEFWRAGPYIREDRRRMLEPSLRQPEPNFRDDAIELQSIDEMTVRYLHGPRTETGRITGLEDYKRSDMLGKEAIDEELDFGPSRMSSDHSSTSNTQVCASTRT